MGGQIGIDIVQNVRYFFVVDGGIQKEKLSCVRRAIEMNHKL